MKKDNSNHHEDFRKKDWEDIDSRKFKWRQRYLRLIRVTIPATLFIAAAAAVITIYLSNFSHLGNSILTVPVLVSPVIVLVTYFIFRYLRPTSVSVDFSNSYKKLQSDIEFELDNLRRQLKKLRGTVGVSEDDKAKILTMAAERLEEQALEEQLEKIRQSIDQSVRKEFHDKVFSSLIDRLGREVQDSARRGNLNLFLGMLTTVGGVIVLGYAVFHSVETSSVGNVLVHFVPRASLAILIEIFAYFFLRLYKQSLSEIKYFQNELTNVQSRQIAFMMAVESADLELLKKVIDSLCGTERNFILNKGQTTVDLERDRLEKLNLEGVMKVLRGLQQ